MTLLISYWALSALIYHAASEGNERSVSCIDAGLTIITSIILGPFLAPFIIHKAIRFVFEYIDRSEG